MPRDAFGPRAIVQIEVGDSLVALLKINAPRQRVLINLSVIQHEILVPESAWLTTRSEATVT